jgi:hypothetical protein
VGSCSWCFSCCRLSARGDLWSGSRFGSQVWSPPVLTSVRLVLIFFTPLSLLGVRSFFFSAPVLVLLPKWICCLDLESCAWSLISRSTLPLVSFDLSATAPVFDPGNRFPVQNAECAGLVSCLCPRSLPCLGQRFHLCVSVFTARAF